MGLAPQKFSILAVLAIGGALALLSVGAVFEIVSAIISVITWLMA